MPIVQLSRGPVHYIDAGSGPVVVLVHGLLVDGTLWGDVVPLLAGGHRVIVPDLPLGAHRQTVRADADLSPAGLAAHVAEFLEALDLRDVVLVGNDTGGAICQLTVADHPGRIARLVLTNCDAYEHFPPAAFRSLLALPRIPGALWLTGRLLRTLIAYPGYRLLTAKPLPASLWRGWVAHASDPAVRRDLGKVLRGIDPRETLRAIDVLRTTAPPTLLAWGDADRFFRPSFAERLVADLPDARIEWIPGGRTLLPVDEPQRVAELVAEHARTLSGSRAERFEPPRGP